MTDMIVQIGLAILAVLMISIILLESLSSVSEVTDKIQRTDTSTETIVSTTDKIDITDMSTSTVDKVDIPMTLLTISIVLGSLAAIIVLGFVSRWIYKKIKQKKNAPYLQLLENSLPNQLATLCWKLEKIDNSSLNLSKLKELKDNFTNIECKAFSRSERITVLNELNTLLFHELNVVKTLNTVLDKGIVADDDSIFVTVEEILPGLENGYKEYVSTLLSPIKLEKQIYSDLKKLEKI